MLSNFKNVIDYLSKYILVIEVIFKVMINTYFELIPN